MTSDISNQVRVFKALSSELRILLLQKLTEGPSSAPELAKDDDIKVTPETVLNNLRKLEEAELLVSEEVYGPGNRPRLEFSLNGQPNIQLIISEQYEFEFDRG